MEEQVQHILNQIPLRHDWASYLTFLGVFQGFFLSGILFLRAKSNSALYFLAWTFLVQSLIFLDNFSCYTGLMKYAIYLNDSSEPLVLLIGPLFYFFVYQLLRRKSIPVKQKAIHFLVPLLYAISQVPFYLAPLSVKVNAYLGAYFRNMERAIVPESMDYTYHIFKDRFHLMVLASFLAYTIFCGVLVWREHKRILSYPANKKKAKYQFTRNSVLILLMLFVLVFTVFYRFEDDAGDHYISLFNTLITFSATALILIESRFFEKSWVADKYETLKGESLSFARIEEAVSQNAYFLKEKASLKDLAETLGTSPNLLSKTINLETGGRFNDYINQKRVETLKSRLLASEYAHLTIEAIGETVGFSSKSTLYEAFKKYTGHSPAAFVKLHSTNKSS